MEMVTEELNLDSSSYVNDLSERREGSLEDGGVDEKWVLAQAREDLMLWDGYFNENVTRGKDDLNFCVRDQWNAVERSEFNRLFKPAMTFNKIYDIVKKIVGEQRDNAPDLMVRSLTGKATQDQIELRSDLVRTICYQSQTDLVYQTAFKSALLMGWGAFELNLEYESAKSFNRVIRFNLVPDVTQTSFDPIAVMPHKGDGNFYSRRYNYTKEQFNAQWPHISNPVSYSDPRSLLDFQWETRDTIVVCKHTRKEWFPVHLYSLSNGMTVTEDEWRDMQKQFAMVKELAKDAVVVKGIILDQIPTIVTDRNDKDFYIRQYLLTQNSVIEFIEWPSKFLPGIFVDGDSNFVQGQQYTKSYIHEAKDAQKFINYVGSEIAAEIKNRRREQWMATPDNIEGEEQMWRNPELQLGALIARPDPKTGQMPQKMPPWDLSQQLLAQFQRGTMDIKETMGYFDENQGNQTNAVSGIAIKARQSAGNMSARVQMSNLSQAIAQAGRVVLDLLPAIYGENERHVILSKADGSTRSVILNKVTPSGDVYNSIEAGEYDIEIDAGPSFAVQKEASMEMMLGLCQANPQVFPLIADLIAENMDLENTKQVVERLENLVPPQVLAKSKGEQPPPQQPDPQQQMMQMEMQSKQQELQDRQAKLQLQQQQHEIEKQRLAMDMQELQLKQKDSERDHQVEMHKADMSYTTDMAKVLADVHKHQNPNK